MCGIVLLVNERPQAAGASARSTCECAVRDAMRRLRHRGPDWSGQWTSDDGLLFAGHERLAIVRPESGRQPIFDDQLVLVVNGEIYNYTNWPQRDGADSESDCAAILRAYRQCQRDARRTCAALDGDFAFALIDLERRVLVVARDRMGVCPLYVAHSDGDSSTGKQLWLASEIKALPSGAHSIRQFAPGHCAVVPFECAVDGLTETPFDVDQPVYGTVHAFEGGADGANFESFKARVRNALEAAVLKRLNMADVPIGVLLSGGLDSSLVAAIASRHFSDKKWGQLKTFSIGLAGSPDLAAARQVAQFLDTDHHEFHFTLQDGLQALGDAIRHMETYDVTTVRAGTPMYLLARLVKSFGIKCVLSGEGADEALAGYRYFHWAPSPAALHAETVRKLRRLHHYDVLRANKAMAAAGVEVRVPFLDADFLRVAMRDVPAHLKMVIADQQPCEKWLLRQAFTGYLPDALLWRAKEQFSDGVGRLWIDSLRALGDETIGDDEFDAQPFAAYQPALTKEAYLYRLLFRDEFKRFAPSADGVSAAERAVRTEPRSMACSTAVALEWHAAWQQTHDPSGHAAN